MRSIKSEWYAHKQIKTLYELKVNKEEIKNHLPFTVPI